MRNEMTKEQYERHIVMFSDTEEEIQQAKNYLGEERYKEIKNNLEEESEIIEQHLEEDETNTVDYFNHSFDK